MSSIGFFMRVDGNTSGLATVVSVPKTSVKLENLAGGRTEAVYEQTMLAYSLFAVSLLMLNLDASARAHKLQPTMRHNSRRACETHRSPSALKDTP